MFNMQRLKNYMADQEALKELAYQYLDMIDVHDSINSIELEDDGLHIETVYYDCYSNETNYYTMPIRYVCDKDWKKVELERQEKVKEEKRLEEEAEKKRREEESARAEKELFLTLKEKYEGT